MWCDTICVKTTSTIIIVIINSILILVTRIIQSIFFSLNNLLISVNNIAKYKSSAFSTNCNKQYVLLRSQHLHPSYFTRKQTDWTEVKCIHIFWMVFDVYLCHRVKHVIHYIYTDAYYKTVIILALLIMRKYNTQTSNWLNKLCGVLGMTC